LGVTSEINLSVWRKFRSEGIEIPFPQREVRLLPPAPDHDATPSPAIGPAGELSGNPA
jgi:small-conductance mechanosensitive channel